MPTLKKLKIIVVAFAVIIVVLLSVLVFVKPVQGPTVPTGKNSAPATSPDGRVVVTSPLPNVLISSPLAVAGTVTGGGWFFEASFPVRILDGDGTELGGGPAQAQSDWTTTGTVPFAVSIPFTTPKYATGTVVLAKDNPSGLPQNAEELRVPVNFK
ncbi:MAG: Gmad2 immunoglobulin-like domain-containing protein [Minisyncoccia bacterium]|jgi:hypothetical protein